MSIIGNTDPYRDCYATCRAGGGAIQACMETCQGLMPGDASAPVPGGGTCSGLWDCFTADLPGSVQDVTGAIHQYALQPLQGPALAVAAAAVAVLVLVAVLR